MRLLSTVAPLQKNKSHPETLLLFTYARLRQMLNNSSTEADNMQLYLGYRGARVLSLPSCLYPARMIGISLQAEQSEAQN